MDATNSIVGPTAWKNALVVNCAHGPAQLMQFLYKVLTTVRKNVSRRVSDTAGSTKSITLVVFFVVYALKRAQLELSP